MLVHCPPEAEQEVLRRPTDNRLHKMVTEVVDRHDRKEQPDEGVQHVLILHTFCQRIVDRRAYNEWDRELRYGVNEDGSDAEHDTGLVGFQVAQKALDDPFVEGAAEYDLVLTGLRADDSKRLFFGV